MRATLDDNDSVCRRTGSFTKRSLAVCVVLGDSVHGYVSLEREPVNYEHKQISVSWGRSACANRDALQWLKLCINIASVCECTIVMAELGAE